MREPKFTDEEFARIRSQAEEGYAKIGAVPCPYLGANVEFNAEGIEHIKFQRPNRGRLQRDQFIRLKLLRLAPTVLRNSHTLQGIEKVRRRERVRIRGEWQTHTSYVHYYEFIAVIENIRVKVIVKKVDNGPYYFWSIIPHWKQRRNRKKLSEGNPEID